MKTRMNDDKELTDKQLAVLRRILNPNEQRMASHKQMRYMRHLGYDGEEETMTSSEASKIIDELLIQRRGE